MKLLKIAGVVSTAAMLTVLIAITVALVQSMGVLDFLKTSDASDMLDTDEIGLATIEPIELEVSLAGLYSIDEDGHLRQVESLDTAGKYFAEIELHNTSPTDAEQLEVLLQFPSDSKFEESYEADEVCLNVHAHTLGSVYKYDSLCLPINAETNDMMSMYSFGMLDEGSTTIWPTSISTVDNGQVHFAFQPIVLKADSTETLMVELYYE